MKISITLLTDSYNTYPNDLVLEPNGDEVYLELNDRTVSVRKSDLIKALKIMED